MRIVQAKCGEVTVGVLMDDEDADRLDALSLSLSMGSHGYAQMYWDGRVTLLHRWIMNRSVGDGTLVDHENRNRLDCRRSNLRLVTPAGNSLNHSQSEGRYGRGIKRQRSGRFQARVKRDRVEHYLGTYDTIAEAKEARRRFIEDAARDK